MSKDALTLYELDLQDDHGVRLHAEPSTMQRRGCRLSVNVDGVECAAYLGPRDAHRLSEWLAEHVEIFGSSAREGGL